MRASRSIADLGTRIAGGSVTGRGFTPISSRDADRRRSPSRDADRRLISLTGRGSPQAYHGHGSPQRWLTSDADLADLHPDFRAIGQGRWQKVIASLIRLIGPGNVQYSAAPNDSGQSRTGTIMVQDQVFTVTQNSGERP